MELVKAWVDGIATTDMSFIHLFPAFPNETGQMNGLQSRIARKIHLRPLMARNTPYTKPNSSREKWKLQ